MRGAERKKRRNVKEMNKKEIGLGKWLVICLLLFTTFVYTLCVVQSIQAYNTWKEEELKRYSRTFGGSIEYWRGIVDFQSWHEVAGEYLWGGLILAFSWIVLIIYLNYQPRKKLTITKFAIVPLFLFGFTGLPIAKASSCEINVVVALDEEFKDILIINLGIPGFPTRIEGEDIAQWAVEDIQSYFYDNFDIIFNIVWVDWDSDDSKSDAWELAMEAHNEISHDNAMLWVFTDQPMNKDGQAIPWLHVFIVKYSWEIDIYFTFTRIDIHEIGHLFNQLHCSQFCLMNPEYVAGTIHAEDFCSYHAQQINYWKWHWQEIQPPPPASSKDRNGGGNWCQGINGVQIKIK